MIVAGINWISILAHILNSKLDPEIASSENSMEKDFSSKPAASDSHL
jgi:hypothetical protein